MEAMEMSEVYEDVKTTEEVESCCSIMEVTSPKKRKSRSPEDMTDKPKKPRSAYLLYYFDVHQIMQQESPNLPQSEINKRISESWKRLSVAEKGYYLEKAKLEKDGVDTSSLGHAQDLPGFRKILPRANCVLLRKGSSSMAQAARSQPDVCGEPLDSAVDGGPPSLSLPQEPKFSSLAPGGEVELAEQCIAVKALAEDAAAVSHATDVHGVPPPSCPSSSKSPAQVTGQAPAHNSQGAPGLLLRGSDVRVAGAGYSIFKMTSEEVGTGGAVVQPVQGETAQVVTLIPAQNLVEPKSLSSANSVGSVMMVSVGANVEQTSKPTYKMAVKTYTRRGRGRCLAPGCSFVYVTRHKPPTCPECGNYLGGKWVPGAKKTSGKDAAAQQQKAETKANNTCQPKPCSTEGKDSTSSNANGSRARKEGCGVQVPRKQHAVTGRAPLEGGSTKTQSQLKPLKAAAKGLAVKGQDKSYTAVKKRPVRPILPAYCTAGRTLLQFITLPPDKGKAGASNNKSTTVPSENTSGLKPSTLKQLGHSVSTAMAQQNSAGQPTGPNLTSLVDKGVNVLSVVPFKQNISSFDLGLSTARGRGRCKNPSCDYVYKNRHKPVQCPKCGWELAWKNTKGSKAATLLDPYQALSPAQRDIQRQSTLQLLRQGLQFPESEAELQDTLALIQELNGHQVVLTQSGGRGGDAANSEAETEAPAVLSGWSQFYESAATHCGLCQYPLFKGGQSTVAGQEDCWLLTETLIQTASLQLKVCLNTQCLALHSFTDLHAGLFNIGNRLLVSLDLFLKIRAKIKLGHHPAAAARTILDHVSNHPVHALSPEESSQVWELLLSGYWAFECLTVRDYNDMICGVCGVAPKLEVAQRFTHNVLEFRNVEFTWPEFSGDEVHVDDFWMAMESEAVEQAAFPSDVPITQVDASIIAPFIPPLMRSPTVINTEKDKVLPGAQQPSGDPALLVRLIHEGQLRLDQIEEHTEDELRAALESCGESRVPESSKDELLASLIALYVHIQNGLPTGPPPPANRTAGKLSKVCPHKVVCGSKYMVRGETARDHVDLLLSSRYWPPVYVADCARQVALCADVQYPELASQMWGRNQGCFSDPLEKPQLVSCAELQDQPYSADHPSAFAAMAAGGEQDLVHPVTRSSSRWLVHPACEPPHLEHHSMGLCTELEPYGALVAELERGRAEAEGSDTEAGPSRPLVFDNTAYYYLYNRLVDFMSSRDIVSQQISQVLRACQPGEVVIRDALYRLGVAQINTEGEEGDVGDQCLEVHEHEGGLDGETIYEVVLP